MLSYRHAFHAGNFADVMKHVVLTALLKYLTQKDAGLCYIDTHAGAGGYDLTSEFSQKTGENDYGIAKIWGASDAPEGVADYLALVRQFNYGSDLGRYPGSPWLAEKLLRPQDRLMLCEMHSSDYPTLNEMFKRDRRVHCYAENGYQFSVGLMPPIERRGLIFMDPSFELDDEYETAVATIGKLHRRFATGTYALWYPILDEHRSALMRQLIDALHIRDVLNLEFHIADSQSHPGMVGCGMIIINPPWTLRDTMGNALPWLVEKLGINQHAGFKIEQWVDE